MKNIFRIAAAAVFAVLCVSCDVTGETYKVQAPEYTAIKGIDGQYVCFAYDANDLEEPVTVFHVEITNTTNNDADVAVVTITDCAPVYQSYYYLDAVRFKVSCNPAEGTVSATDVDATEPSTCFNVWLGQGYYTYAGKYNDYAAYKVAVTGKIGKQDVTFTTGYKGDSINFTYSRTYSDGLVENYVVKGVRNSGWEEEMSEYSEWMDENL